MSETPLFRVVIAISAYRSDVPVLALLKKIFVEERIEAAAVVVVDSLSDGSLEREIKSTGWPIRYENSSTNLGSAGNLAYRLKLAATYDADWCFAINHDGMLTRPLIENLVEAARQRTSVGAVFPKRILIDRAETILKPHTHIFDMPVHDAPQNAVFSDKVAWDSSNGALYGLAPVRQGVGVWSDLWYGWEDLAYGWQLTNSGWNQYYCGKALYMDDYEYQCVSLLGKKLYITRKPAWTSYYGIRNLILVVRRTGGGLKAWSFCIKRLAREVLFTVVYRDSKLMRLKLIAKGLLDGLKGTTGQAALF